MSKAGGSLPRGRRRRHEVPEVPDPSSLTRVEQEAQAVLRSSVEAAGGRFGTERIPVRSLDALVSLLDAWGRDHAEGTGRGLYFNGRPGLWHALDRLYPLQDPNRWDPLRLAVTRQLEKERGWERRNKPRGSGFDLPA